MFSKEMFEDLETFTFEVSLIMTALPFDRLEGFLSRIWQKFQMKGRVPIAFVEIMKLPF